MPDQSSAASEHALLQEITAPLQTLPDDALAIVEADFPTVMRGYDRHAVDDYVDQVSHLVAELQATRSPEAAVRRALERVGDQISGILQRAHETAESITAQSRSEAEDRLEQARREAASIIDAAERRVRELDADTDRIWAERQGIVADAEALSERLREVAQEAAQRFPAEAERAAAAVPETLDELPVPEAPGAGVADLDEDDPARGFEADPVADDDTRGFEADPVDGEDDVTRGFEVDPVDDDDDVTRGFEVEPPEAERTLPYPPSSPTPSPPVPPARDEPRPRRITDEASTRIIPPSSDAAQHRREE